jgi:hypothetical protein
MYNVQSWWLIRAMAALSVALSGLTLFSILWGPAATRPGAYGSMLSALSGILIGVTLLLYPPASRRRLLPLLACGLALMLAAWAMVVRP